MRPTSEFVSDFMSNLREGKLHKTSQPNKGPNRDEKFVEKKVNNYKKIVNSDVVKKVLNGVGEE